MISDDITEDTPFVPEDDTYHEPTIDDPLWFETTWWSFSVPERRLGGWLHAGRHTNQGTVTWRVFAWDPSGADPGAHGVLQASCPTCRSTKPGRRRPPRHHVPGGRLQREDARPR